MAIFSEGVLPVNEIFCDFLLASFCEGLVMEWLRGVDVLKDAGLGYRFIETISLSLLMAVFPLMY